MKAKKATFKITLPVKPHIRKYMHIMYGCPLIINQNSLIGSIIIPMLLKKTMPCGINTEYRRQRQMYFTAGVECILTMYRGYDDGIQITENHILAINRLMENQFNDHLYQWVQNKASPGEIMIKDYYSILKSFMHHYCLEEDVDISLETIRKAENRRRWQVKKNRKNLMQENVRDVFSHR